MCLECVKIYEKSNSKCLFIVLNDVYYLIQATGELYNYTSHYTDNRITDSNYLLMLIRVWYPYL